MECYKCGKSGEEVRLLDCILNDEIVKVCEDCSFSEDIPMINKPTASQLKESERPYTVKERLRRMAGLHYEEKEKIKQIAMNLSNVTLDDLWRRKKDKEMEEKFEFTKKKDKPMNLVDNFHWTVFMARRKKKLTRHELAKLLGESETAIKMLENKEIPNDSLVLINKLEQFLGIKLKKEDAENEELKMRNIGLGRLEEKKEKQEPIKILSFDKNTIKNITIADLQKMKEQRMEKAKLEKLKKAKADELLEQIGDEEKAIEQEEWEEESKKNLVGNELELE